MNGEGVLQLWVKGENHLLVWGPRLGWEEALGYFERMERPTVESLLRPGAILPETHRVVTKTWREEIGLLYRFPAETEVSEAVAELVREVLARGVEEVGPGRIPRPA
jgi:hypothetical protein